MDLRTGRHGVRDKISCGAGDKHAAANIGGYLNFTKNISLLFSTGRSFSGDHHTLWYLALYSTWGP